MEKIEVRPIGITASPDSPNAYALILKEKFGTRSLPIIIGPFEAQSIALVLEGMTTPRPLTHDLMKEILEKLDVQIEEVFINDLREGTFYARIIFENPHIDVDARPSDAVALALRLQIPIYVSSELLDEAGMNFPQKIFDTENEEQDSDVFGREEEDEYRSQTEFETSKPKTRAEELQEQLEKAIKEENYEQAAKIRDELRKILKNS